MKAAVLAVRAAADIQEVVDYYLAEAPHALEGFIAALEKATAQVERHPGTGSPRYAQELNIPGLRHWSLSRYPYAIFYIEHADHLYIMRLVHLSRHIPASLGEPDAAA